MVDLTLAPATLRPGLRIYVVGDVHGCLERLVTLHLAVGNDLSARPVADSLLVHLGDYVDRGPDSAGVLALLTGSLALPVSRRVDLRGNHEAMMLAALSGDSRTAESWLMNGGTETLESYGISPETPFKRWADYVPVAHRQWIGTLPLTHAEDGYLFVHAGIRPGQPLSKQAEDDLLWIREPFLSSQERHPLVVVHGHTPSPAPEQRPNRIGIDTGAVMGGELTCLVLERDRLFFLSA